MEVAGSLRFNNPPSDPGGSTSATSSIPSGPSQERTLRSEVI